MQLKVQVNEWPLIKWRFNCISTKEWNETRPSQLCLKPMKILVSAFKNEVVYLISINYNLLLSVDPAFCESYACNF